MWAVATVTAAFCLTSDQVGEVGDARQRLVDGKLERNGSEQEDERQLETILRLLETDGERSERHAADEELHSANTESSSSSSFYLPNNTTVRTFA